MANSLARVKRAARRRVSVEEEWKEAIREAVRDGHPVREVARAAGVTHPRVIQIAQEE